MRITIRGIMKSTVGSIMSMAVKREDITKEGITSLGMRKDTKGRKDIMERDPIIMITMGIRSTAAMMIITSMEASTERRAVTMNTRTGVTAQGRSTKSLLLLSVVVIFCIKQEKLI